MTVPEPATDELAGLFRLAFRRQAATVAIITFDDAHHRPCGMTATAVCPLSASPPSVLASVNRAARTRDQIRGAGSFGVNFLGPSQEMIATHCSKPGWDKTLPFAWVLSGEEAGQARTPVIAGGAAHLDCTVSAVHDIYTHSLFVGRVTQIWLGPAREPLIYCDGAYCRLDAGTEHAYEQLWERVMSSFL